MEIAAQEKTPLAPAEENDPSRHCSSSSLSLDESCKPVTHDPSRGPVISKNQQKKLKRKQQWEEGREARKARRKEKIKASKQRKRAARQGQSFSDADHKALDALGRSKRSNHPVQLPVTFLIDCQFDDLMTDSERISLASQLTRCYSENRKAPFRAHLAVSSFDGKLAERFENILENAQQNWQGVDFSTDDFVQVAEEAKVRMRHAKTGGTMAGALAKHSTDHHSTRIMGEEGDTAHNDQGGAPEAETVYLTSESPETLQDLKPYSTYVIGGLVDKNRHKGICYKRALDRGVKTAKLPIGDYMKMQSRFVLATNHVNEIMLKWLSTGDWAKAFVEVMPQRKGGSLRIEEQAKESTAAALTDHNDGDAPERQDRVQDG